MTSYLDEHDPPASSALREAAAYAALSRITLRTRPVDRTLGQVAVLARRALLSAPEVSVTLLDQGRPRTAAASGDAALRLDERQYDERDGPSLDAAVHSGIVAVATGDRDGAYPGFRQWARREGVTHALSVALPAMRRVKGSLTLYGRSGQSFGADSARIAGTFAGFAAVALAALNRDGDAVAAAVRLQQALASRAVVNQAQGILMTRLHCSRDQGFAALIRLAEQQGLRLHQAAQVVVDQTPG